MRWWTTSTANRALWTVQPPISDRWYQTLCPTATCPLVSHPCLAIYRPLLYSNQPTSQEYPNRLPQQPNPSFLHPTSPSCLEPHFSRWYSNTHKTQQLVSYLTKTVMFLLRRASPEGQSFRSRQAETPSETWGKADTSKDSGGHTCDDDYENVREGEVMWTPRADFPIALCIHIPLSLAIT